MARPIVLIPHLFRLADAINFRKDYSPPSSRHLDPFSIPDDYEVYECEEFQMEGDPISFEEAMRIAHSSKWLEAMKDEIKSMKTNGV